MHRHKEGEWPYVLKRRAHVTAVDHDGRTFIANVGEGDLWHFPSGIPHSIQELESDIEGVEWPCRSEQQSDRMGAAPGFDRPVSLSHRQAAVPQPSPAPC